MAYEIIWSPNAHNTFHKIVDYLQTEWGNKEVEYFIREVFSKIESLESSPRLGAILEKNVHRTVLNKRVTLVYKVYPRRKTIRILSFWNTWQDPSKLKY